ncbi:hypothetical protein C8A01DRAFT_51092 [Parachaetomium inaequale]|uniref:Uncharacterized protein n=1 Tax=Parachaetomium inaequale TaxID=2588326 RepID=A0AAN6P597_9PEZI|nr:hypothetical protein C8A01DRAFT_51092 [Parachaetomium inaequale]
MAASRLSPLNLALAALAAVPYIVLLAPIYSTPANAQLIDCYKWDGTLAANNTRCPGSNACCGPNSVCLSNRLCTPDRDPTPEGKLVRGPCAVKGWDDSCPQICTYKEGERFPRVGTCPDGSLCCDDDDKCCEKGLGIFLDESGNRVSTKATGATTAYPPTAGGASRYTLMPSVSSGSSTARTFKATSMGKTSISTDPSRTTGTSRTTSGPESSTTTSGTYPSSETSSDATTISDTAAGAGSSSSPSPSSAPSSSSNNSNGLKLGLGLGFGIPVAMLATGALMYCWLRPRGHRGGAAATSDPADAAPSVASYSPGREYGHGQGLPPGPAFRDSYVVEAGGQMSVELSPSPQTPKYAPVQGQLNEEKEMYELH